jgi:hypothetical protein
VPKVIHSGRTKLGAMLCEPDGMALGTLDCARPGVDLQKRASYSTVYRYCTCNFEVLRETLNSRQTEILLSSAH